MKEIEKNKPRGIRTATAGATIALAALFAVSFNQSGLTGRATGGAVGCGGAFPEDDIESETKLLNPTRYEVVASFDDVSGRWTESVRPVEAPSVADAPLEGAELAFPTNPSAPALAAAPSFGAFMHLAEAAGMADVFEPSGDDFVLLVPTDRAMGEWGRAEELLDPENRFMLRALVEHHIVPGRWDEASQGEFIDTALAGQGLEFTGRDVVSGAGSVARVMMDFVEQGSHLIPINAVLEPSVTVNLRLVQHDYVLFYDMLRVAGELERLGDPSRTFAVFAPSDLLLDERGWTLESIEDPEQEDAVFAFVQRHVVSGDLETSEQTDAGAVFDYDGMGGLSFENGPTVRVEEVTPASNGFLYESDTVIDAEF
jgi:uncharacterized surface protein with fasciclin (FAS1) repeats